METIFIYWCMSSDFLMCSDTKECMCHSGFLLYGILKGTFLTLLSCFPLLIGFSSCTGCIWI